MPRAVRFDRYGGPDVLEVVEVARPEPGDGQLLVRVRAAGLNPFDSKLRRGFFEGQIPVEFPAPQGTDLAGIVEAVGAEVTGFAPGDEIVGSSGRRGAQAEYALVAITTALPRPPSVSWEAAGGLWVVATTAAAMIRAAGVGAGDVVLVSGASGGVGGLVSQLAHHWGASVIGVSSAANHEWLRAHGVRPVAYGEGVEERIREAVEAAGGPLTAVLDTAGGGYAELGIKLGVAPERIDTVADYGAAERLGVKQEGGAMGTAADVAAILDLMAVGELELPVHASFPLDQVQAAYTELEQGHPRGKIVLIP